MVGKKIIAKRDNWIVGIKKGDKIRVTQKDALSDYRGKNLTRGGTVYFETNEVKSVAKREWIYFLGIPLFYMKRRED